MTRATLPVHLDAAQLRQVAEGRFPLIDRLGAALGRLGITLDLRGDDAADRQATARRPGWSLVHLHEPLGPRQLTLRRAYFYPFWRIERTTARWHFRVVNQSFSPDKTVSDKARRFQTRLRDRICGPVTPHPGGYLYMPLQGRLAEHRSFQSMSPLAMIEATLDYDPREVRATLHPKESYSETDIAALTRIAARNPRFRLLPAGPDHLPGCDAVVTQNSSVAMTGFLLDKPAVLFAGIDFHHIAGSVPRDGLALAFASLHQPPDFAAYLWWFFQTTCIDAMSPVAEDQILGQLRAAGWAP
jgi:hypothetical protein